MNKNDKKSKRARNPIRTTTCPYMEENDSEKSFGRDQNLSFFVVLGIVGVI
jgi:hypothetical protein